MVIIDSLNGYINAMPEESFLVLQLHELLAFLGQRGVVTILVVAQQGVLGGSMASPMDVTYLADTVLLLRHFEAGGELRRAISVMKKRTGSHESSIRELHFGPTGVTAGRTAAPVQGCADGRADLRGLVAGARQGRDQGNVTDSGDLERRILVLAPSGRDAALGCRVLEQAQISGACGARTRPRCSQDCNEGAAAALVASEALTPERASARWRPFWPVSRRGPTFLF